MHVGTDEHFVERVVGVFSTRWLRERRKVGQLSKSLEGFKRLGSGPSPFTRWIWGRIEPTAADLTPPIALGVAAGPAFVAPHAHFALIPNRSVLIVRHVRTPLERRSSQVLLSPRSRPSRCARQPPALVHPNPMATERGSTSTSASPGLRGWRWLPIVSTRSLATRADATATLT